LQYQTKVLPFKQLYLGKWGMLAWLASQALKRGIHICGQFFKMYFESLTGIKKDS